MGPTREYFMKTMITPFVLLLLAVACDAPQQRRMAGTFSASSTSTTNTNPTPGFTSDSDTKTTTDGTTGTAANTVTCTKTAVAYHAGLGNVDVCQNAGNELNFKLTFSTTDQSDGTCIIPMYKDAAGNSTYLGSAQCTKHNQGQVVMGNVSKGRTGYAGYQVNSVMVVKYSGSGAFFQCMNAYGTTFQACMNSYRGLATYQAYCDNQAKTYMSSLCNTFKTNYPYSQVSTR